jgi:hypothetical protein
MMQQLNHHDAATNTARHLLQRTLRNGRIPRPKSGIADGKDTNDKKKSGPPDCLVKRAALY